MTEPIFDQDRLDVYRLSIVYFASSFTIATELNGCHRHARDQWLRAAQSIPLNIAEGNGKRSLKDCVDVDAVDCAIGCRGRVRGGVQCWSPVRVPRG